MMCCHWCADLDLFTRLSPEDVDEGEASRPCEWQVVVRGGELHGDSEGVSVAGLYRYQ